jgi:hypothetical protein
MSIRHVTAMVLAALGAGIVPATAQETPEHPLPRWYVGVAGEYGHALGTASEDMGGGGGIQFTGAWRMGRQSPFTLRMSGHVLIYGSETNSYPVLPGLNVDITTTNLYTSFGVGPQFVAGGPPVEAYVFAVGGGTYMGTYSQVEGEDGDVESQVDDVAWSAEAGGGFLIHLNPSVAIDAGARYQYIGEITYLPQGQAYGGGGVPLLPRVTGDVSVMVYHLGMTMRLGGGVRPRRPKPESEN